MNIKQKLLKALQYANDGKWDKAHITVQDLQDEYAFWIHANLHREEGDISNSKYWYRMAGREYTEITYKAERDIILEEINRHF